MIHFLKGLKYYLYSPTYKVDNQGSNKFDIFFGVIVSLFLWFIITIISQLIFVRYPYLRLNQHKSEFSLIYQHKYYYSFVIVFLAPLIEETICRLILKYTVLNVLAFLFASILIINGDGYLFTKIYNLDTHFFINVVIFFLLSCFIFFILIKYLSTIKVNKPLYFPFFFYLTAFVFSLGHIFNFSIDSENVYILPLLIFPYFIDGLVLGYIRMKSGFLHSLTVHIIINFIPSIILLLQVK